MKTLALWLFLLSSAGADECVPAGTDGDGVDSVAVDGETVKFCLGTAGHGRSCWSVALADGKYLPAALTAAPASAPAAPAPANDGPTGEAKGDGVDVCSKPGQCRHIPVKLDPHEQIGAVVSSPDASWVAVIGGPTDDGQGHGHLQIYDVASGKMTGRVSAWTAPRVGTVWLHGAIWVGSDLVQILAANGGGADSARVVDVHAKLISDRPALVMDSPQQLSDGRWALGAYNGEELSVIDAKHNARHYDLSDLPPGGAYSPIAAIVPTAPGSTHARLVLVLGNNVPAFLGDMVVIDEKTGKHKRWKAPRCH